ncbi:MAG: ABC transporter ATP-binding protein, partial [Nitrososphaera sp.]|nr:ABC transporter ATP-binding protein [Nitrososphaera sp.]
QRNGQSQVHNEAFWALKDATFAVERGENVGIIGLNGAGKSTLLKILSRITEPTEGNARIAGRVGALLEVGTGFHWELTGRENVYLYGAILGMSKAEITRKFDTIVSFAGIEDFIDTPVKRYSSGMYVRLAFAVAAHMEPEILLLDEVLSVGDLAFQRKCMEFARELQRRKATILFVSHNMFSIKTMCPRVIYLKQGQIQFDGPTDEGIKLYEDDCRFSVPSWAKKEKKLAECPILITDVALLDDKDRAKAVFDHGERMTIRLRYKAREAVDNPNFVVAFIRSDLVQACVYSSEVDGLIIDQVMGEGEIELRTPPLKLTAEYYAVHIVVHDKGFQEVLCAQIGSSFHVRHDLFNFHFGIFHESGRWLWGGRSGSGGDCLTIAHPSTVAAPIPLSKLGN